MTLRGRFTCDDKGRRPVVDAAGISRGDRAIRLHQGLQSAERFQTGLPRMLVTADDEVRSFALGNGHQLDLTVEAVVGLRVCSLLLTSLRKKVLVFASDAD